MGLRRVALAGDETKTLGRASPLLLVGSFWYWALYSAECVSERHADPTPISVQQHQETKSSGGRSQASYHPPSKPHGSVSLRE